MMAETEQKGHQNRMRAVGNAAAATVQISKNDVFPQAFRQHVMVSDTVIVGAVGQKNVDCAVLTGQREVQALCRLLCIFSAAQKRPRIPAMRA